jgi:hypothetical protein
MAVPLTLSSVPAQTPYVQYVSGSGQTVFPYPFEITQDSDLVCLINGIQQGTDAGYTLSGQGATNGGNLTFTVGQTAGTVITLYRNISIARITQLAQNGTFFAANFNNEFNRIYLIMQQLQQSLLPGGVNAFALMVPNSNSPAPTTLLTPAAYANKFLSFDSNGNPQPALLTSSGAISTAILAPFLNLGQTAAESAALITPTSLQYPELDVRRYGALATNSGTQNATAIQQAISVLAQHTWGELVIPEGLVLSLTQVTFTSLSQFSVRCDGVINSSTAQQGTPFTNISGNQGTFTPFKFSSCTKFKLYGKGYINNGFVDALYATGCSDFDWSLDCRGQCVNSSSAAGNSTMSGMTIVSSDHFKLHDMVVTKVTSQNMNNSTDVFYEWAHNIFIGGSCSAFELGPNITSSFAGYGAFFVTSNNTDFSIHDNIGEFCSGTACSIQWSGGGVQPMRCTVTGNVWRQNQEDSAAIANQSGSNATVSAVYSNNVSLFPGWCNCSQGTTAQSTNGGSGILTVQFVNDLVISGNTSFEHTTAGLSIQGCNRVVGAGNTCYSSIATTAVNGLVISNTCSDIKFSDLTFDLAGAGGQSILMTGTNTDVQLTNCAFPAGQISISGTYTNCKFNNVVATCPSAVSGLFDWVDCALTVTTAGQQGLVVGAAGVKIVRTNVTAPSNAIVVNTQNYCDIDGSLGASTGAIGIQVVASNGVTLRSSTGTSGGNAPGIGISGACDRPVVIGCKGSSAAANGLNMASGGITNATLISFTTISGGGPSLAGAGFLTNMNVP